MMLRLKTYCIALLLLVPLCLHSQDFAADMEKSSETYLELKKFSMTVQAQVYSLPGSKTPEQKMLSYIKKYGNSYKTITNFVETLYNPRYVIAVSKMSKTIMYAPNNKKIPDLKEVFPLIDSTIADYDSVVYKGIVNGDKFYKIYLGSGAVEEVEIYLRPDFLFSNITYVCRPGQSIYKMETLFKDI